MLQTFEDLIDTLEYLSPEWGNDGRNNRTSCYSYEDGYRNVAEINVYTQYTSDSDNYPECGYDIRWVDAPEYTSSEAFRERFENSIRELYRLWRLEQTVEKFISKKAGYKDLKKLL